MRVTIAGNGLESILVTIAPGTIFLARTERVVLLRAQGSTERVLVPAACANMELGQPTSNDAFTIAQTPAADDLLKLLALPGFTGEPFRIQQFAIWTVTDNPARGGYVRLRSTAQPIGSGPSDDQLQHIRVLYGQARIAASKHRALR